MSSRFSGKLSLPQTRRKASGVTWGVIVRATKSNDLSSTPRIHMVKKRTNFCKSLLHVYVHHTHTNRSYTDRHHITHIYTYIDIPHMHAHKHMHI